MYWIQTKRDGYVNLEYITRLYYAYNLETQMFDMFAEDIQEQNYLIGSKDTEMKAKVFLKGFMLEKNVQ